MADIGVVIGEVLGLRGDRVGDLLAAIADIDAVETGEGVDAFLAVDVPDVDAFAAGDDAGRRFAAGMRAHMGRGMEEMVAIPGGEFVGLVEHFQFLFVQAASRQRYLRSVKASRPWREPSRPMPDCLTPPNGIGAPVIFTRLIATMP